LTRIHVAILLLVAMLGGWVFAPALSGNSSFALRDAAHYYHPLFQWIRGEWGAGRVPLWNPLDNLGISVVGENTTSVFYPGKLIFALPLDFTLTYNLYVVAHVALAAWGSFRLARRWDASVPAAGLAALCYAFSGDVLFQVTNVVFLVGAAWLPWALFLTDIVLGEGRPWAAVGLGAVLALMITGGDPQMAMHAMLLAGLYALLWNRQRSRERAKRTHEMPGIGPRRTFSLWALALLTCLLLAAVQILPSWEATRQSARASHDAPRNVYELVKSAFDATQGDGPSSWHAGLLSTNAQGHAAQIYQFSVGPWRAIEYLWPNISGRQFPTFHRWLDAWPAEGRVWTPSLYLGLLPFVLAVCAFRLRPSAATPVRMASWMVVLGGLASLGIHGLAWFFRETALLAGQQVDLGVGDQVGGLYWLLTVVVPGYVYFRYPAKLMVIVSLGLAMLAAHGWDQTRQRPDRRIGRTFMAIAVVSLAGLAIAWASWSRFEATLAAVSPDPLFGPFDPRSAWQDLSGSLVHTALLSLALALLLAAPAGRQRWTWAPAICVAVTAGDLAIAQAPLISYAPADTWRTFPLALRALAPATRQVNDADHPESAVDRMRRPQRDEWRFFRDPELSVKDWRHGGSPERPGVGVRWERNTLAPRYHLPYDIALVEVRETLSSTDELAVWQAARRHADAATGLPHGSVLDLLGARFALVPRSVAADGIPLADDVAIERRSEALPRAWIVHEVISMPLLRSRRDGPIAARTEEVLFPAGAPRDWLRTAVVETADTVALPSEVKGRDASAESCDLTLADPQRVEITVNLTQPGLVVLRDRYDPGWRLSVVTNGASHELPILLTNRVMRGVALPPGKHRLVYQYRPHGVWIGGAVSLATILGISSAGVRSCARSRRRAREKGRRATLGEPPSPPQI
jgi:hypothetical protein